VTRPEPRLVRAAFDDRTVTVYQAYSPEIADAAVRAGTFVPPFSLDRMTWIKPSFGWMMHRCGWASKPGQERVLAIQISRTGFEWVLANACLSHYEPGMHDSPQAWAAALAESPVRVQWDPDRSLNGDQLPTRAIQVGLAGEAARRYVREWITSVTDITSLVRRVRVQVQSGQPRDAHSLLPPETMYPLPVGIARRIGADPHPAEAAGAAASEQEDK
jgi:uncharacterized protein DUF4291